MGREKWGTQVGLVFGLVVVSFLAATAFTQWQLLTVREASSLIAEDYAPSIEHLATARGEMRHVQLALHRRVAGADSGTEVGNARRSMDDAIAAYFALPSDPVERQLSGDVLRAKDAVDAALAKADEPSAPASSLNDVSQTADALNAAITRDIELNASRSHESALRIERAYRRARALASLMALLCVIVAVFGALAVRRAFRAHAALASRHREVVEARATELEAFAGRVAHDIINPLSIVNMSMRASATAPSEQARIEMAERGSNAIRRIDHLIRGLLAFAVAGATPQSGESADVPSVMTELEPELRSAAEGAKASLSVSVDVAKRVACNRGVLASIIANLAHNAIKYVAKSETRRIEVRAKETPKGVEIDVVDTGPGLPPGLEDRVFEPYVRGINKTSSGIGLGLATVKRLAMAHGGEVGVESRPGKGCVFWVLLPTTP